MLLEGLGRLITLFCAPDVQFFPKEFSTLLASFGTGITILQGRLLHASLAKIRRHTATKDTAGKPTAAIIISGSPGNMSDITFSSFGDQHD